MAGSLIDLLVHWESIPCLVRIGDEDFPCDVKFGFGDSDPFLYQLVQFKSSSLDLNLELSLGCDDIEEMKKIPVKLRALALTMERNLQKL